MKVPLFVVIINAILIVLLILVVFVSASSPEKFSPNEPDVGYPYSYSVDNPHKLISAEEVDPLITGRLYAYRDNMRGIYAARTSHHRQGLKEFSSEPDYQLGYDTGLWGDPGSKGTHDDQIPENWNFPSTPHKWYSPTPLHPNEPSSDEWREMVRESGGRAHRFGEDYYNYDGPNLGNPVGMYHMSTPDHEPYVQ